MNKNENTHLNRQLSPFNKAWYRPKHQNSQVNGHTEQTQPQIILANDVVTKHKK